MRKLTTILSLLLITSFFAPTIADARCSWWANLWGNCDKKPTDYPCYGTITISVQIAGPGGSFSTSYQEVEVMTGNRIDCKVGSDYCNEESSC